jgi:hypothetical protein
VNLLVVKGFQLNLGKNLHTTQCCEVFVFQFSHEDDLTGA